MTIKYRDLGSFQDAFLDYLEGARDDAPKPEDLLPELREDASAFIKSITVSQGIDPYASRPSIEQLIANRREVANPTESLGMAIQEHLRETVDDHARVTSDSESIADGLGSVLLIQAGGVRMHAVPELGSSDLRYAIGSRTEEIANVFDAFTDCQAVLYTTIADEPLAVVLDRVDAYAAFETPSGKEQPPRLPREPIPTTSACEIWFRSLVPAFKPVTRRILESSAVQDSRIDPRQFARHALAEVSAAGRRARIDAKRSTWTVFGDEQEPQVAKILDRAHSGPLTVDAYKLEIERLVAQAL